ncbi:MAG: patatin-like phospholipase family protein [candidate division Zixibacteria bacterium]|nr:patatin-like phospholipase family protein [candidate division Zixibacteria bacterium]
MAKKKLGLALGGGGAAGLAHIGALRLLEQEGLVPDLIVGSSIGAAIGALYALDPDAERLAHRVEELLAEESVSRKWHLAVPQESEGSTRLYHGLVHFIHKQLAGIKVFTTISLRPAEELEEILTALFGDRTVSDTRIPFGAVVLDIVSGRERVVAEGLLSEVVYASAAIPGVFPPHRQDEQLLVDGAFTSNCPVGFTRALGADYCIAVRLPANSNTDRTYETGIDVLSRTDEIVRRKLTDREVAEADIVITPPTEKIHWADFGSFESTLQLGWEAAAAELKKLRKLKKLCHGNLFSRLLVRMP